MAINAYTGLPGSGKSYTVVERVILPALKDGRRVWTNIPMSLEMLEVMEYPGTVTQFQTNDIVSNENWFQEIFEPGATIIIDECWRFWPSGLKATQMLEGHKSFFAEHRHMVGEDGKSTEVILVTQNLSQIASTLRDLVEFTYVTTKLKAVGASNRFRVDVYEKAVTGTKLPKTQHLRSFFGEYKQENYRYYQSQTMSASSVHGDESSTDESFNIWSSPIVRFGFPVFFLVMFSFIFYGYGVVYDSYFGEEETTKVEVVTDPVPTQNAKPKKQPNPMLRALTERGDFFITFNNGIWPAIDYKIKIVTSSAESIVTINQLKGMGFQITTISQCLVILRNQDIVTPVSCLPDHERVESDPLSQIEIL